MNAVVKTVSQASPSVLVRMANRFGVDAEKMLHTLKATAFKGEVSNEQMMALLVVAEQYGLNPWTKEIYAFPDSRNGIVPVIGVDGWSRIINSNKEFDGMDFLEADDGSWIECVIHRKDRTHPIKAREWMAECKRSTGPWQTHPRRMLRHKAMIQCARLAFGFVGVYDPDEAERIIDATVVESRAVQRPEPDPSEISKYVSMVAGIIGQDKEDHDIGEQLQAVADELNKNQELYCAVFDRLATSGTLSKQGFNEYLDIAKKHREKQ